MPAGAASPSLPPGSHLSSIGARTSAGGSPLPWQPSPQPQQHDRDSSPNAAELTHRLLRLPSPQQGGSREPEVAADPTHRALRLR